MVCRESEGLRCESKDRVNLLVVLQVSLRVEGVSHSSRRPGNFLPSGT